MEEETLQLLPEEKWSDLEPSLKLVWSRSILIIDLLDTLRQFPELRRQFDFKIYCPYGDADLGVVITCMKKSFYEVIIHCNREMERVLEAIKCSKIINWEYVAVQFTDRQVMESLARTMRTCHVEWCHLLSCDTLYLDRNAFEVEMYDDVRFGLLSEEHVAQVNSTWEHRYPGSDWYFEQLVKSKLGFGLFEKKTNNLIAWVFHVESGTFDNLHVLNSYRKKGYGELLAKIVYNTVRKYREHIYVFCVKGNDVALNLYEKLEMKMIGETFWTIFKSRTQSKI